MRALAIGCLGLVMALPSDRIRAQVPGPTGVTVTPVNVIRVVLVNVKDGERPAFDRDMVDNLIPVWEEYKKAGIITDYSIFTNVTLEEPGDWDVGYTLVYANYAALDNLGTRTNPITLKHYGTAEKRTAAGRARTDRVTIVSSRLIRDVRYSK